MTRKQYCAVTNATERVVQRLPGKERILNLPTYICALVYLGMLTWLLFSRDVRLTRASMVPAAVFVIVTCIRPVIHRQRPYDRFGVPPVGRYEPGKGKSMPSRHTASAAAIVFAIVYVFPSPLVRGAMVVLGIVIGLLRVVSGQHYPSDVAAAYVLAAVVSWFGYRI